MKVYFLYANSNFNEVLHGGWTDNKSAMIKLMFDAEQGPLLLTLINFMLSQHA